MRIAGVIQESIVDGPGVRFVVFVQGCPHHCPGCHNQQTHDFEGGYDCTVERIVEVLGQNKLVSGVTLSGGEPFCQPAELAELAERAHALGKDVIVYSGYTFEQLCETARTDPATDALLRRCDILIDGPYLEAERDLTLPFRGSRNQRILDLPASLAAGRAVEKPLG